MITRNDEQVSPGTGDAERPAEVPTQSVRNQQDEWPAWTELASYGQDRARAVAAARGVNWDSLTETEREDLIDTLLHESS